MKQEYSRFNPYLISSGFLGLEECPEVGVYYPTRVVKWYEFELIHDSIGGYIITRDYRIEAKRGILMIRKPGTVVRGVSAYGCHSIIFDGMYDDGLSADYKEPVYGDPTVLLLTKMKNKRIDFIEDLPDFIEVVDYQYFKNLFEKCLETYLKQEAATQFFSKLIIYNLLSAIIKEVELKKAQHMILNNQNVYEVIQETKQMMDEKYDHPFVLDQLANYVGYTKEAYCRSFKKIIGKSPIDYLIYTRIFHSKRLLITTSKSIYDIALSCGFNNDTYFYKVFKKREGISPAKYRKLNKMNIIDN